MVGLGKTGNLAPPGFTPLVLDWLQSVIAKSKKKVIQRLKKKKQSCIPLNKLILFWAASNLKSWVLHLLIQVWFFFLLFIYLARCSTKWSEQLLDVSVATLGCCSIRCRPPWFLVSTFFSIVLLAQPVVFFFFFSSNPNIHGSFWWMNLKQGAQRGTVSASAFCFSKRVIEKVILAWVFILRADDLHSH